MEVVVGFFYVWVERKFMGLGSGGKKISRFVFKFVGWVCVYVYVCWLGLISGGGGWIFLCLGKFLGLGSGGKKIYGFVFKFFGWVCVYVY